MWSVVDCLIERNCINKTARTEYVSSFFDLLLSLRRNMLSFFLLAGIFFCSLAHYNKKHEQKIAFFFFALAFLLASLACTDGGPGDCLHSPIVDRAVPFMA